MTTRSVTDRQSLPDPKIVLALRRQSGQPPLFCIHPGSGFGLPYIGLLPHIGADVPVYALQARGLVGKADLPSSIGEMADDYATQIQRVQPYGPYRLLGWCVGGRVAFEIACRLRAARLPVDLLALLGTLPPDDESMPEAELVLRSMLMPPTAVEMDPELARLCRLPLDHSALQEYFDRTDHPMRRLNERSLTAVSEIYRNNERLIREPVRHRFDGSLQLMVPAEIAPAAAVSGWQPYVNGPIEVRQLTCRHAEMMEPGPLSDIGAIVDATLRSGLSNHGEDSDD